jgi:hypothetical protein
MEHCPMCDKDQPGLVRVTVFGGGVFVCTECAELVYANKGKPYSKVMDRFALLECGYRVNRKTARTLALGYSYFM